MHKNFSDHKKMTAALLAGAMFSLTAVGNTFASTPNGPGAPAAVQEEQNKNDTPGYWSKKDGIWYFYHEDGTPAKGWIVDEGKHYYMTEIGRMLSNSMTPDGYYVDPNGEWKQYETTIGNQVFKAPEKFASVDTAWAGMEQLGKLRTQIRGVFKERRLKISDSAIEYVADSRNGERVLLGLYKMPETDSYRLDIGASLDASSTEMNEAATYDYMVFRAMLYQISSTPDQLGKAIYSSWEESNSYGISREEWTWVGDAWVKYSAASGKGLYSLYPVK